MVDILLEGIYILAGLVLLMTAFTAFRDEGHPKRVGTTIFWAILGLIFIFGPYLPPVLIGSLLLFMGVLTAAKQVTFGTLKNSTEEFREKKAKEIGSKIFIPALSIAIVAFSVAQFTELGGLVGLGFGAIIATIIALITTKTNPKYISHDGSRLLQQVGSASILPQLLAALGALFNAAGVGEVISNGISGIIPEGNILAGVIAYCVGMAVFTMVMGNAFAAFAVITAGVGLPFVFAQGADPAVAGVLALTAGYCGTLMTPMAANFNIVPAAILETKSKNRVIISQIPVALTMLVIHVVLMYTLAF